MKKRLADSQATMMEATAALRKLVEDNVPAEKRTLLKATPPTELPKLKPERRILQAPARTLVVAAG